MTTGFDKLRRGRKNEERAIPSQVEVRRRVEHTATVELEMLMKISERRERKRASYMIAGRSRVPSEPRAGGERITRVHNEAMP